jgi:hypothetical protein
MAESSKDAIILITVSYQALQRAEMSNYKPTLTCDCIVMIVFAGYFIEANLNYIIKRIGKEKEVKDVLGDYAGLQDKLAWFYNTFIARPPQKTLNRSAKKILYSKLRRKFPGFGQIYRFRNKISHGRVSSLVDLDYAKRLRIQAKDIVDNLFQIVISKGYKISRNKNYREAINFSGPSYSSLIVTFSHPGDTG